MTLGTKPLQIEDVESGAGRTREGKTRPSVVAKSGMRLASLRFMESPD